MVVERVKQRQMQRAILKRYPPLRRALPVFERHRPAGRVGRHRNPIGPQQVQFACVRRLDQLDIGVARHQQVAVERLEEACAGAVLVGACQQFQQRMLAQFLRAVIKQPRHGSGRLGHHAHRPVHDRVVHEPLARQRRIVAPRPAGVALRVQRHEAVAVLAFEARAIAPAPSPRPVPTHHHIPFSSDCGCAAGSPGQAAVR